MILDVIADCKIIDG